MRKPEAQFWIKYKNLLGHLEETMEDAYQELKRLVDPYTATYLFPLHELYCIYICIYTYEKYNTLLDVLLNILSVKLLIVNSLVALDKQQKARNVIRARDKKWAADALEVAISDVIRRDILPMHTPPDRWSSWLHNRYVALENG